MAGRSCLQWGMYQAVYVASNGAFTNTFNNVNTSLYNTNCDTTRIDIINADGLTFFNVESTAKFGNTLDPEYSERSLRLQFQP